MIQSAISIIEKVVIPYGATGVFAAAFLEEVIAPIPSSFVAMFSGFFLLPIEENLIGVIPSAIFTVAIPMSMGMSIGSLVMFSFAYFGGKPIILRWGRWFGLEWSHIDELETKLAKGHADELILFGVRSLPIIPSVAISAFCGMIRYPVRTFFLITFLGSFIRSFVMAIIGWQAREAYILYSEAISRVETFVLVGIIALCASFMFWRVIKSRNKKNSEKIIL